jgi:F-type H+-transporting ATPase subunit b
MSNTDPKPAKASFIPKLIIGLILGIGGTYLSVENLIPGRDAMAEKGLQLDFGMTIATIGIFLVLFPLIDSFFLVPLRDAIQDRNTNLERTFAEAEELRSEMSRMRSDYEKRLVETEAEARAHIQAQIREAQELRTTLMQEAASKTEALVSQAEADIAAERDRLISDLRGHVVDLALAAAEKVIGENMDSEKNRRMVDEFISRVEAVH